LTWKVKVHAITKGSLGQETKKIKAVEWEDMGKHKPMSSLLCYERGLLFIPEKQGVFVF